MEFDRTDAVDGIPLPRVRDYLRVSQFAAFGEQSVTRFFGFDRSRARRWLRAAAARRLIESREAFNGEPLWGVSDEGARLAAAKFLPRFDRARADRLVAGFLERVEATAARRWDFLMEVRCAALFGSCLDNEAEDFGDVDLFCEIDWLPELPNEERIARARRLFGADGRTARGIGDEMCWPFIKLRRFLRGRQAAVSLHMMDEAALYDTAVAVLYELPGGRLAAPRACRSQALAARYNRTPDGTIASVSET